MKTCLDCPIACLVYPSSFLSCGDEARYFADAIEKCEVLTTVAECPRRPELGIYDPTTIAMKDCPEWWGREINIAPLHCGDEPARLLASGSAEYNQYFTAFDANGAAEEMARAQLDRYWGIWCNKDMVGFFMLRGFDEGYERPSFGVYIAEEFARHGLCSLAVQYALSWCRLNQIKAVMLKAHSHNVHAWNIYEHAGFHCIEICDEASIWIMEKRWD